MSVKFDGWVIRVSITGVRQHPAGFVAYPFLHPTADGTLVNYFTRVKMWQVEAFEMLIDIDIDIDTLREVHPTIVSGQALQA